MKNSFYSKDELLDFGFASIGKNVLISRQANFYNCQAIHLGSSIRIDDFCIITAREPVKIGSHTHLSAHSAIYGGAGFIGGNFVTISGRVAIYTESDDFSGMSMTNPTISKDFKPGYKSEKIILEDHAIIGTCSTLLPGATMKEGSALAAHSLANTLLEKWTIYGGVPAKPLKARMQKAKEIALAHYNSVE